MKNFEFVPVEVVIDLHQTLLDRYGGSEGGGHRGSDYAGVESAIRAVENSYYNSVY